MRVSSDTTSSDMDTIMIEIPKSQLAMLLKKGSTLIDQGGNLYSMNALTLSNLMFHEDGVNGAPKNKSQWGDQPKLPFQYHHILR